eukprot:1392753-Amorphochlora_amoeboformis.AAC.1
MVQFNRGIEIVLEKQQQTVHHDEALKPPRLLEMRKKKSHSLGELGAKERMVVSSYSLSYHERRTAPEESGKTHCGGVSAGSVLDPERGQSPIEFKEVLKISRFRRPKTVALTGLSDANADGADGGAQVDSTRRSLISFMQDTWPLRFSGTS